MFKYRKTSTTELTTTNQKKVKYYKETIKELAIYCATSMFYLDSLNSLANVEEPVKRKKDSLTVKIFANHF